MNLLSLCGIRIAGVVACLPENLIPTRESCVGLFGEKGVETLIKATGIHSRGIANAGTSALDLGVQAAEQLLEKTDTKAEEIGAVLCVTFTPEYIMPSDAPAAQSRLGLSKECLAFDINMACSGYGYGLYLGALLTKQLRKKVLVLDGDVQSAYVSTEDKATVPVMADVGTATLLDIDEKGTEWKFSFYTEGENREALFIPVGGSRNKTTPKDLCITEFPDGSRRRNTEIYMNGFEIFKFVSMRASKFIREFMECCSLDDGKIDVFVPHQANIYMISELTKKLKLAKEKMWKSGDKYGNPASASVPLTIAENAKGCGIMKSPARVLFAAFGGGLSASVGYITLDAHAYYDVIQYSGRRS